MQLSKITLTSGNNLNGDKNPSVLAITETIAAVSFGLYFSSFFDVYAVMLGASFAAFMFLLRSDSSVEDGRRFFDSMFKESPDPDSWMEQRQVEQDDYRYEVVGFLLAILLAGASSLYVSVGIFGGNTLEQTASLYLLFSLFLLNIAFFSISLFGSFSTARLGSLVLFLAISLLNVGLLFSANVFLSTLFVFLAVPLTVLWIMIVFFGAGFEVGIPSGALALILWTLGIGALTTIPEKSTLDTVYTVGAPLIVGIVSLFLATVGLQKIIVAPALVLAIAARALFARFLGTVLNLRQGIKNFPRNWIEQTFCVDCFRPPELVPGLPSDHAMSFSTWISHVRNDQTSNSISKRKTVRAETFLIALMLFFPAFLYRVFLKSSAWVYFPIIWFFDVPSKLKSEHDRHIWIGTSGRSKWDLLIFVSSVIFLILTALRLLDLAILDRVIDSLSENNLPFVPIAFISSIDFGRFILWDIVTIPVAVITVLLFFWLDSLRVKLDYGAKIEEVVTYWKLLIFLEQTRNKLGVVWVLISLVTVVQVFLLVHVCPEACRGWRPK